MSGEELFGSSPRSVVVGEGRMSGEDSNGLSVDEGEAGERSTTGDGREVGFVGDGDDVEERVAVGVVEDREEAAVVDGVECSRFSSW